jgi:hypothetical protein
MSEAARRLLSTAAGLGLGAWLLWRWFDAHSDALSLPDSPALGFVILGLLGIPISIGFQILRTALLLGLGRAEAHRVLARPVVLAHGLNVLLPSMAGDMYEVWGISRATGRPVSGTLVVLLHRMGTTLASLGVLAALAFGLQHPGPCFALLLLCVVAPLVMDATMPRWSAAVRLPGQPAAAAISALGPSWTALHLGLAVLQHLVEAGAWFFLAIGIGDAVAPDVTLGMVAVVDALTYLPIPLAGLGVNHWGAVSIAALLHSRPVLLVLLAHLWQLVVGILCVAGGSVWPINHGAQRSSGT